MAWRHQALRRCVAPPSLSTNCVSTPSSLCSLQVDLVEQLLQILGVASAQRSLSEPLITCSCLAKGHCDPRLLVGGRLSGCTAHPHACIARSVNGGLSFCVVSVMSWASLDTE